MIILLKAITTITANDITTAACNCTVIANAEQIPSTWTVIGLSSFKGSDNNFKFCLDKKLSFSSELERKRIISFFLASFSDICVLLFS